MSAQHFTLRRLRVRAQDGNRLISLINIVFLLLIFFMLMSSYAPPSSDRVTLPQAQAPTVHMDQDAAALTVTANGTVLMGQRTVDLNALKPVPAHVQLLADRDLLAADLAVVLGRLEGAGVSKVSLVTRAAGAGAKATVK